MLKRKRLLILIILGTLIPNMALAHGVEVFAPWPSCCSCCGSCPSVAVAPGGVLVRTILWRWCRLGSLVHSRLMVPGFASWPNWPIFRWFCSTTGWGGFDHLYLPWLLVEKQKRSL